MRIIIYDDYEEFPEIDYSILDIEEPKEGDIDDSDRERD